MPSQRIMPEHQVALGPDQIAVTPFGDHRPLFRFLQAEFADALIARGSVKINTLFSFRSIEQHGPARGDPREGDTTAVCHIDDLTLSPTSALPPFLAEVFAPPPKGKAHIRNVVIESGGDDVDYYLYSAAELPDHRLFQAFDCDTCVRISKPRSFFRTLSEALSDRIAQSHDPVASMKRVHYGSRYGRYNPAFDAPGPFVKPVHLAYQREVRMLWTPVHRPIEPFVTAVPSLSSFCDIFARRSP
jgi:hypothetical protein